MDLWKTSEGYFHTWDETKLFYRTWEPQGDSKKAIIVLHRGHEHSGRLIELVENIGLKDFWAFAWDSRGHGNSPGERGYAESFNSLVRDLDSFVEYISQKHNIPIENIVIVANSVAGVIATTWVHDYAPKIRAMVLAAPAFRIKLYIPFAIPLLRILQIIKGRTFIKSYVKSKVLTHDVEQVKQYDSDKLITKNIALNILLGLHDTATRIVNDAGAIYIPVLILSAGSDWVVKNPIQQKFFKSLSSEKKEMHIYPDFYHGVFYEKDRHLAVEKARKFILESFDSQISTSFLIDSDKKGYTKREYERLKEKSSFPYCLLFFIEKMIMKTLGRLSNGVQLGLQTGFDSGRTLDYVYENQPKGITLIGKWIDRSYLNSIGWKGIRERKVNLESILKDAINKVLNSGKTVKIMDIASGPGRYILDVIKEIPDNNYEVLLRDYNENNLKAGQKIAKEMGISNAKFSLGDAFNIESYSKSNFRPNIAVVSGLYELFPDNENILESLKGISSILEDGGFLIYTGQPWHPQIEMIARVLINREGKPWIMRRRTQAEMDALVEKSGFKKVNMLIDNYGIFTVSLSQK